MFSPARRDDIILFEPGLYFSHLSAQHYLQSAETVWKLWPRMFKQGEHILFPRLERLHAAI